MLVKTPLMLLAGPSRLAPVPLPWISPPLPALSALACFSSPGKPIHLPRATLQWLKINTHKCLFKSLHKRHEKPLGVSRVDPSPFNSC